MFVCFFPETRNLCLLYSAWNVLSHTEPNAMCTHPLQVFIQIEPSQSILSRPSHLTFILVLFSVPQHLTSLSPDFFSIIFYHYLAFYLSKYIFSLFISTQQNVGSKGICVFLIIIVAQCLRESLAFQQELNKYILNIY